MIRIALVCTAALLLSGCGWFGNLSGAGAGQRMSLELAVGIDPSVDGDVISTAFDDTGTAELITTGYDDAYDNGLRYQAGISYEVSNTVDITLAANYATSDGRTLEVGNVSGIDPITADFGDYETYGAEIGLRKYFRNKTFAHLLSPAVSPYIGLNVGIQHVESIGAILTSDGFVGIGQPTSINAEFYEDSLVPTAQIIVGAEWRANNNFSIGLETGVRYRGDLSAGDNTLVAIGLQEARDNSHNISIPITLRGRFKF
ncbi:MAG: hypothetical protein JKX99_08245 [Robiginitomaculum sp.]|nr:hypothetical protein [Robiginitomaculum sp.]